MVVVVVVVTREGDQGVWRSSDRICDTTISVTQGQTGTKK